MKFSGEWKKSEKERNEIFCVVESHHAARVLQVLDVIGGLAVHGRVQRMKFLHSVRADGTDRLWAEGI